MLKIDLHKKADKIARLTGFKLGGELYRGNYYSPNKVRNIIFQGKYKNSPAVLKIYDDPRLTDEPISQITFNKINTSKLLIAPKVYKYKIESLHQG